MVSGLGEACSFRSSRSARGGHPHANRAHALCWALIMSVCGDLGAAQFTRPQTSRALDFQCSEEYGGASAACADDSAPALTASTKCCSALAALDSVCLQDILSSLNDADQGALGIKLLACGIQLDRPPTPSPPPPPPSPPRPPSLPPLPPLPRPGQGGAAANGGGSKPLPEGDRVVTDWAASEDSVMCSSYNASSGRWEEEPGSWGSSGSGSPSKSDIQEVGQQLCEGGTGAGPLLVEIFGDGGPMAQAAMAVLLRGAAQCPGGVALSEAFDAFIRAPELGSSKTVMGYVDQFVAAADAIGAAACVTVAVLNRDGTILDMRQVHTGAGGAASGAAAPTTSAPAPTAEQCEGSFAQALAGCSAEEVEAGTPCCTSMQALGPACLAKLGRAAEEGDDALLAAAFDLIMEGCNLTLPIPAPSPRPAPGVADGLPPGDVKAVWHAGPTARCEVYNESARDWQNATGEPWGGSGGGRKPDENGINEVSQAVCKGAPAAALLVERIGAGGQTAKEAAAGLLGAECSNSSAPHAAFDAFTESAEVLDPATVMRYAVNFVDACDALGAGACVTVVVVGPDGSVLATKQVHTKGPPVTQADDATQPRHVRSGGGAAAGSEKSLRRRRGAR